MTAQPARGNSSRLRWPAFFLAVLGCAASAVLLGMEGADDTGPGSPWSALCAPTATINCNHVLRSPWARFGPFPMSTIGLAYFVSLAAWFMAIGAPNRAGRAWHLVPLTLCGVGLCASILLTYVMAARLPVWCTWCLAVHAVNALLFVFSMLMWRKAKRLPEATPPCDAFPSAARAGIVIFAAVGLVLLAVTGSIAYRAQAAARLFQLELLAATNTPDYIVWRYSQSPVRAIDVSSQAVVQGPPDAPNSLVVFTDYQCPQCGAFATYLQWLLKQHSKLLSCAVLHFPMSRSCNPHGPEGYHPYACEAARAAEAAALVGTPAQAETLHRLLYGSDGGLGGGFIEKLAVEAGLDRAQFLEAMHSAAVARRIEEDVALAHSLGVEGTPALFFNGRRLQNWRILTSDVKPKIDVKATDALWRILLAAEPVPGAASDR